MRALALPLALAALPAAAAEEQFSADESGLIGFRMPSGNIACTYVPGNGAGPELSCDRVQPAYAILTLGEEGGARIAMNPEDGTCCSGPVLNYGNHWQEGPFRCTSETTGLTCRREDGRGFSMARAKIELF